MQLKDYYKTLELQPAATTLQVKKSFRQLALKHHPDRNPGNAVAEAKFKEIQEAYEILVDPKKREDYNYKCWYSRSLKKEYRDEPMNPVSILAECDRLNNYMHTVNILRVDFDGLSYHIRQLLNDTNIGILQQFNNEGINAKLTEKILQCAGALPFKYIDPITSSLKRIAGNNHSIIEQINSFTRMHKQKNNWQKYKLAFVAAITIILCWIIYKIGK